MKNFKSLKDHTNKYTKFYKHTLIKFPKSCLLKVLGKEIPAHKIKSKRNLIYGKQKQTKIQGPKLFFSFIIIIYFYGL